MKSTEPQLGVTGQCLTLARESEQMVRGRTYLVAASSDSAGYCMVTDRDKHSGALFGDTGLPSSLECVRFSPSGEADERPTLPWFPDLGTQSGILEGGDPGCCVRQ